MPITPLSKPLKTEYKPLGLEAFAQPLSQMQAKFDVAKSQIEDADYKIDRLNWANGDEQAAKELANSYNEKATDLAGKLLKSGNYREASSALKKINKSYNNDPAIQSYQSNAAGYKAVVAAMDKAVVDEKMTSAYRDLKLRKIKSEFSGTNFNPKTGEYNKINASSAMNNINIEDKIMTKATALASASAEQQDLMLGKEITRKLRKEDGRLAFDDIVAHLRQSSEFKEYSKEKAELDFFAENERVLQSENPFALADALIGTKIGEIDQALASYSQDPEKYEREIEIADENKKALLALAENKTQDPQSYFGTAENIYVSDHDYLEGTAATAADIYDYQKIDLEEASKTAVAKTVTKVNEGGPFSTEIIGVTSKNAMKVDPGSIGMTTQKVLQDLGFSEEESNLGSYFASLDDDDAKQLAKNKGRFVYQGSTIGTNIKKINILKEQQDALTNRIEDYSELITQKKLKLSDYTGNDLAMRKQDIEELENKNIKYRQTKANQVRVFNNLMTLEGSSIDASFTEKGFNYGTDIMDSPEYQKTFEESIRKFVYQKGHTYKGSPSFNPNIAAKALTEQSIKSKSIKFREEISALAKEYANDTPGYLEALNAKAKLWASQPQVKNLINKSKINSSYVKDIAYNITADVDFDGSSISQDEQLKALADFNVKSGTSLQLRDLRHYRQYVKGEHLKEDAKEEKELYVPYNGMDNKGPAPRGLKKGPNTADNKYTVIMDGYNKVAPAIESYQKEYNYAAAQEVINKNNPYQNIVNDILTSYEEATTLSEARNQTVNAVVIDNTFIEKAPSTKNFMTNVQNNLKEYAINYDINSNGVSTKTNANNIIPSLYDTKTMRVVSTTTMSDGKSVNVYAINRKKNKDVPDDILAAAFTGVDKKMPEGEGYNKVNKQAIDKIKAANTDILYITDNATNINLVEQAKLNEVESLQTLAGANSAEKEDPKWIQAKNTVLNDLVNLALLNTDTRGEYISQASNLSENVIEGRPFSFQQAPSVIKTITEPTNYKSKELDEFGNNKIITTKPGDKVYNTILYQTDENRKLSYRVERNIIIGYNKDTKEPIIKKQILEAKPMSASGIPSQMMKHSIMFGVGNSNSIIIDGSGQSFYTDLDF